MQQQLKDLERTVKKSKVYLTIWFSIAIVLSVVSIALGSLSGIAGLLLNPGYIYTLYQKDIVIKKAGFWIHAILSVVGVFLLVIVTLLGVAYYSVADNVNTSATDAPASSVFIILIVVLVIYLLYFLFTIIAIVLYWKHCKASDLLRKEHTKGTYSETHEYPMKEVEERGYSDDVFVPCEKEQV